MSEKHRAEVAMLKRQIKELEDKIRRLENPTPPAKAKSKAKPKGDA